MTRFLARRVSAALALALTILAAAPASASMPPGSVEPGWQIVAVEPLDVDGTPVALSPDGAWLAGTGDDDEVCIWGVADGTATCTDAVRAVDPDSISWAPDSSAIAFSALAYLYLVDSDIHVLDVDGGLTNVTDDRVDDRLSIDGDESAEPVPVDVMPAWTPGSDAVVFARVVWDAERSSTDIMSVPRDGGTAAALGKIPRPFAVYTPMHVLGDSTILYSVGGAAVGGRGPLLVTMKPA